MEADGASEAAGFGEHLGDAGGGDAADFPEVAERRAGEAAALQVDDLRPGPGCVPAWRVGCLREFAELGGHGGVLVEALEACLVRSEALLGVNAVQKGFQSAPVGGWEGHSGRKSWIWRVNRVFWAGVGLSDGFGGDFGRFRAEKCLQNGLQSSFALLERLHGVFKGPLVARTRPIASPGRCDRRTVPP